MRGWRQRQADLFLDDAVVELVGADSRGGEEDVEPVAVEAVAVQQLLGLARILVQTELHHTEPLWHTVDNRQLHRQGDTRHPRQSRMPTPYRLALTAVDTSPGAKQEAPFGRSGVRTPYQLHRKIVNSTLGAKRATHAGRAHQCPTG